MADNPYQRGSRPAPAPGRGSTLPGPAPDPLTELARLIGQTDPFSDGGRPAPASPPAPHAGEHDPGSADPHYQQADDPYYQTEPDPYQQVSTPRHELRDGDYYDAPVHDDHYAQPEPRFGNEPRTPPAYGDQRMPPPFARERDQRQDFGPGPYASGYNDDYDDDMYEEAPPRRRRGGLLTIAAMIGLVILGTAGAVGYRAIFGKPGHAPVIRADNSPNKVITASQGGDTGSAKISDRMGDREQNERLVPREEQPVDIKDNARATSPRAPALSSSTTSPAAAAVPSAFPPSSPGSSGMAPATSGPGEPKRIRTVTIKSDQPAPDTPRAAGPVTSAAPITAPRRVGPGAAAPPSSNTPLSLSPDGVVTDASNRPVVAPRARAPATAPAAAPTAAAAPAVAAPVAAAPAPAAPTAPTEVRAARAPTTQVAAVAPPARSASTGGGYVVQLSAQKSEEEAQASFRSAQGRFPTQLGGRQPLIRKKDLGAKGIFYGAQVGPFASRDEAVQLCESLKTAGGTCIVQQN